MRVLIVGGAGFISSAVAERLTDSGHAVFKGDLADVPDIVIDLDAALPGRARESLRAWDGRARRIVLGSSLTLFPGDEYARTSECGFWLGRSEVTIVRLGVVYGAGDPDQSVASLAQRLRQSGSELRLSPAEAWRYTPRLYFENAAAGLAIAATARPAAGRIYNLVDTWQGPDWQWAQMVARAIEWPGRIVIASGHAPVRPAIPSNQRMHRELGYRECVAARDAVRLLLATGQPFAAAGA
jgi:nucleoside-diphosphate-sugar epimerase